MIGMYDRIFNSLAVLTLLGLGFIGCSLPALFDKEEEPKEPQKANIELTAPSVNFPDISYAFEVREARETAKAVIDEVTALMEMFDSIEVKGYQTEYVGEFYLTMYAATVEQCGNDLGITASGRKVTDDPKCHTVAVDPAVIPLGTYLIIEGYDGIIFRADDTGSAINGYDIDIFTTSEAESKSFNNVTGAKVWIITDFIGDWD